MQPLPKKPHSLAQAQDLLGTHIPLIDVRSPQEYSQGAVPNSINLPILSDDERAKVGITYKHSGHDAAVALGHKLVSGDLRQARISRWLAFIEQNPQAQVMCWRGGQRSKLAQSWLRDRGCTINRVPGGYKALRRACIDTLEAAAHDDLVWWVIAGRTGVHKTELLRTLPNSIDLEGLAHHRGSAFGAYTTAQPAPASFENALASAYLSHQHHTLVLEDESRTIGRLALPGSWHERMQHAPLVLLEADLETRVANIVKEYVNDALAAGEPLEDLRARYRAALGRVAKRLGGVLYNHIDALIERAFENVGPHEDWVRALLTEYYDPMYDYQLLNKQARVRFRGDMDDVRSYLEHQRVG